MHVQYASNHTIKPLVLLIGHSSAKYSARYPSYEFVSITPDFTQSSDMVVEGIEKAIRTLPRRPDAVVALNDTESLIASLVSERFKLLAPAPDAVARVLHKASFLAVARACNPDQPPFYLLHHTIPDTLPLCPPFFVKRCRSVASRYAYRINSAKELSERICMTAKLDYKDQFINDTVECVLPSEPSMLKTWIVQQCIRARQYTVDCVVQDGKYHFLGIVQSILDRSRQSFVRFDYPSDLAGEVAKSVYARCTTLLRALRYDNGACDIEFFITTTGKIVFIECNPRLSGQFLPLYNVAYTTDIFENYLRVATGMPPILTKPLNPGACSSIPLRVHTDQMVCRVPGKQHLARIMKKYDIVHIDILAHTGQKLSDIKQDPYSYHYAIVDVTGHNIASIRQKISLLTKELGIVLEPV